MKIARREFMKIATAIGVGGVLNLYTSDIRQVFAQALDDRINVIWLQGASDSGCTISLLQGVNPDLIDVINNFRLSVNFHPNLMVADGDDAIKFLQDANIGETPLDLLIVEGAIPKGNYCTVGELNGEPVPVENWIKALGAKAKYIVAVGTCAAYGGIPAANPNPTMSLSVNQALNYAPASGNVINLPGCPTHPDWVTITLAAALSGEIIQLDNMGRPVSIFGQREEDKEDHEEDDDDGRIHEHCILEEISDDKYATELGQEPLQCLYKLGCKAKKSEVSADCTERLWNNKTNVCMYAGAPCIGCVAPTFPDGMTPFFNTSEAKPTNHFSEVDFDVINAAANNVYFLYPDHSGVKPPKVRYASVSDWTAIGFVIGMCSNIQNEATDTNYNIIDINNGNLKLHNSTIVLFGGPIVNAPVHYYEENRIAPLYWRNVGGVNYWYRADGTRIDETALSSSQMKNGQDMFVMEAFKDGYGNRVYVAYGYGWKGTFASGLFFKSIMHRNINSYSHSYYIHRWIDANQDGFVDLNEIGMVPVVVGD